MISKMVSIKIFMEVVPPTFTSSIPMPPEPKDPRQSINEILGNRPSFPKEGEFVSLRLDESERKEAEPESQDMKREERLLVKNVDIHDEDVTNDENMMDHRKEEID
jgi:hypothetical protein